ncbi:hypothetical protein [Methanobacterium alcaliphilum]|uniref:hypothetical protein n=1 Tax=Methanobacterium alcaliphilum TaxID=392018 RepID=UPI00200A8B82|nr:hypothetical protein [Methanobacterium alcaliphilum]MCK9151715.1 hypothetical protein [Methanobacterium alcaliphilum]
MQDNNAKIDLEELYYLLMSSWLYGIGKTSNELLGNNIVYTRRVGWNAADYLVNHLKITCDIQTSPQDEDLLEIMKSIIRCLENVGFFKEDTVSASYDKGVLSISIAGCRAEACNDFLKKEITPQVCLRSFILVSLLEKITEKEFTYKLNADPESQPQGKCINYLKEVI